MNARAISCCDGSVHAKMRDRARYAIDHTKPRLCETCDSSVAAGRVVCEKCGGTRLAPPWVLRRRSIGRGFEVRITESSAAFGPSRRRLTLSRWYPGAGGRATLNINSGPELTRLVAAAAALAREMGWELTGAAAASGIEAPSDGGATPDELRAVLTRVRTDRAGAAQLAELLQSWSLGQIAAVSSELRRRLSAIALLERVAQDERTYELRTEHSIHRILERSLWLIDERYLLLSSNSALRQAIGAKTAARARTTRLRPDFACATSADSGVIVELKRPRHALSVADLNQVERYLVLAEQQAPRIQWRALLIGGRVGAELKRTAPHRPAVAVLTFAELVADAKRRYRAYQEVASPPVSTRRRGKQGGSGK